MKILVISAHPDDETLGCGATLLKHNESGDSIHWLIATKPTSPQWDAKNIKEKSEEVKSVAEAYNVTSLTQLEHPSTWMETIPLTNIIEDIRGCIDRIRPNQVYTVYGGDTHTDHQIVYRSTMSVLKPSYMSYFNVTRVLAFETLSSTEANAPHIDVNFVPNVFNDVTEFIEHKLRIMALYKSELQEEPHPRSLEGIRALARYRGISVGVPYAESFMLCRELLI